MYSATPTSARFPSSPPNCAGFLDLTVIIDHNVVDGAPAARFCAEFRAILESAAALTP
jgi:pyruvate/2-oxoglutarate dehydrogenase complex dihydrolipoamide acyltransferase (E2) component